MALKNETPGEIKFWTPLRLVSTLIVLGLVAVFAASSCNSNDTPSKTTVAVRPGEASLLTLPAVVLDTELKSANGDPIKISDYSGKVVLLNLWATWCGPCRNETPELVRIHKEYQDRGLEMIGLSTEDPVASAQSVQEFMRAYGVDYHIGWATREVAAALMQGRGSIPQSFIISRDGHIMKRFVGFHPVQTPPQLKQAIEEALTQKG
jgi:peroxiredoxin